MDEHGEEPVADVGSRVSIAGPTIPEQQVVLVCGRERQSPAFLSVKTPLGRALLGSRAGDEIELTTDASTVKFVVLNVRDPGGDARMVAALDRSICGFEVGRARRAKGAQR